MGRTIAAYHTIADPPLLHFLTFRHEQCSIEATCARMYFESPASRVGRSHISASCELALCALASLAYALMQRVPSALLMTSARCFLLRLVWTLYAAQFVAVSLQSRSSNEL